MRLTNDFQTLCCFGKQTIADDPELLRKALQ